MQHGYITKLVYKFLDTNRGWNAIRIASINVTYSNYFNQYIHKCNILGISNFHCTTWTANLYLDVFIDKITQCNIANDKQYAASKHDLGNEPNTPI